MSFKELLDELETLGKALPPAQLAKVDELFGKSTTVTLENGDKVQGFDGLEVLKALTAQAQAQSEATAGQGTLIKALVGAVSTVATVQEASTKTQGEEIAKLTGAVDAMQKSIDAIAEAGRGRRSAVTVTVPGGVEKPQQMQPREFMHKAMTAMKAGRITGMELSRAEAYFNRGVAPPEHIVNKVLAA